MAITNYTELQAALADYLIRSDLTARIPDFIALCEGRLNRTLRVRDMETSFGLVMAAGSGALPGDYLEWISAQWIGSRTADLRYVEPNSEEWQRRYRPSGDPAMFTILAGALKLRPVLPGNVTLYYYRSIPALATASTNWLLARSPDIYLNGSLAEAYRFVKDEKRTNELLTLVGNDTAALIQEADSNKVGRRAQRAAEIESIAQARNSDAAGVV
jgi:hypothetical protein